MAALTGYFDDSGDDGFFSIGGYVAEAPTWDRFGSSWQATLSRFNVRYLHMKELNQGWGEYSSWKKDDPLVKDRIVEFFISLTSVIRDSGPMWGFGAVVSLTDLERFNREKHRKVDAKALAIFACALEMRKYNPDVELEIIWMHDPWMVIRKERLGCIV